VIEAGKLIGTFCQKCGKSRLLDSSEKDKETSPVHQGKEDGARQTRATSKRLASKDKEKEKEPAKKQKTANKEGEEEAEVQLLETPPSGAWSEAFKALTTQNQAMQEYLKQNPDSAWKGVFAPSMHFRENGDVLSVRPSPPLFWLTLRSNFYWNILFAKKHQFPRQNHSPINLASNRKR